MSDLKAGADMELEEGFFDRDQIADEKIFKDEFDIPGTDINTGSVDADNEFDPVGPKGFEAGEEAPTTKTVDGEEKPDGEVDFKFDDALAQAEAKELAELNEKLNTNYKSRAELDAALVKTERNEESIQIDEERKYVNYFENLLNKEKYPDEVLVREDKIIQAMDKNLNPKDPEVMEAINEEVEQLRESGALDYAARSIRQTLQSALNEKKAIVDNFDNSLKLTEKEKVEKYKADLQESISSVFKEGKFMGIQPTKEDMVEIYKDVSKNKHIEHLKVNPKDAVEFALFKKYGEIIKKSLGKPNYEAGVRNALKELGMSNSGPGTQVKDKNQGSDAEDLSFLKRFAK